MVGIDTLYSTAHGRDRQYPHYLPREAWLTTADIDVDHAIYFSQLSLPVNAGYMYVPKEKRDSRILSRPFLNIFSRFYASHNYLQYVDVRVGSYFYLLPLYLLSCFTHACCKVL